MVLREKRIFRQRVDSLRSKLHLREPFTLMYNGASPAFIEYSRAIHGIYPIPTNERIGSIAGLAKRELQMQFAEEGIPQWKRYCLGTALGFTPEQIHIMHSDIGKYMKFVMPERKTAEQTFEDEVSYKKELLEYKKACQEFEQMFPGDVASYFFRVGLELNSRGNAYDVEVMSLPYKPFKLRDPVSEEDVQRLFNHLMGLAGERSKKMMLESVV